MAPTGEKVGISACSSLAAPSVPVLFFIGSEGNATLPMGQFGSPQGSSGRLLQCQPCAEGCTSCTDATPCLVEEARALRVAVLACQACCMLTVFLSMLVAYRCRQSKVRQAPRLFPIHMSYPPWVPSINETRGCWNLGEMGSDLAS